MSPARKAKSIQTNFQKGLSLIELLLVVLIIGFIILVVNNLPSSLGLIGKSHYESVAKDIASQTLEDLRSQGYTNLANGTTTISDSRLSNLPQGSGNVVIINCPDTICKNSEQMKQSTVTITWNEGSISKSFSLVTLITNGGLR